MYIHHMQQMQSMQQPKLTLAWQIEQISLTVYNHPRNAPGSKITLDTSLGTWLFWSNHQEMRLRSNLPPFKKNFRAAFDETT